MLPLSQLLPELEFSTSRSGGPGGQNVNKVETKVTIRWDVAGSRLITPDVKDLLTHRLAAWLTTDGVLIISSQVTRSQSDNRGRALKKLAALLASALRKQKARKATRATTASRKKRLESKRARGEKKKWRRRPPDI